MIKKTRGHGDSALSMIFYTSRLEPMSIFFVKSILQPDEPVNCGCAFRRARSIASTGLVVPLVYFWSKKNTEI
ncbi:MAG: hypothetical protein LBM00_04845, partial [Deltaproteobacteria bacterium]|nr:hypothetical protein [Deltaproteobacteria bacterium]